ncbi:MAG: DUF4369 domain-containing protein [Flavobacteriaceae bacterium]|jgi:hypothetical protein|nr:DUF4369 domain-containing protein [Flavobacteriaceae bacterium]MDB2493650.1 DUF4369 domain-containing protein [Flavobacteriaceae bacterium]MDG1284707.1 DUF4369 domain-containing protein [Flavobacteriaceae bacterium]
MTNRLSLFLAILIMSCTQPSKNTTVSGNIKGLQKGTLYLQHVKDEGFTTLDSLEMTSTTDFQLGCDLDEAEVLFLSLSKELDAERISFFADQGHTTINTTLKRFKYDAQIEGSDQQKLLESYYKNIERFKNQKLELIEAQLNAQKDGNLERSDSLQVKINKIVQRSYLYSINFALNNKDSEVAPFVAVSEIYDANVKYLDTINKVLPPKIANSKYGIILEEYIKTIKSE